MGGEIGAEAREGGGSVFWFTAITPSADPTGVAPLTHRDLERRRVLVVDASATTRMVLEHYLTGWGVLCESADRPREALAAIDRSLSEGRPFDIVLLHFEPERSDARELIEEIRARPTLHAPRIVLLSSAPLEAAEVARIGASAHIVKPASQAVLYDVLAGRAPDAVTIATEVTAAPVLDRGLTVLVAEDNEINAKLAEALLRRLGLGTVVARNGREAVELAAAREYAAIFMDCQMPEMDGFAATAQIRAGEDARHVPIVAMTALSMPDDRERCLAAGMDDFLSKPIRREELAAVVARCLPEPGGPAGEVDDPGDAVAEDVAGNGTVLDPAIVRSLRDAVSPDRRDALLEIFDTQRQVCVDEIGVAISAGDRAAVRRIAHKLKGGSRSLGAARLGDCCEALEHLSDAQDELGEADVVQLRAVAAQASAALHSAFSDR
jgi:CheY-like chemotaxis protein